MVNKLLPFDRTGVECNAQKLERGSLRDACYRIVQIFMTNRSFGSSVWQVINVKHEINKWQLTELIINFIKQRWLSIFIHCCLNLEICDGAIIRGKLRQK